MTADPQADPQAATGDSGTRRFISGVVEGEHAGSSRARSRRGEPGSSLLSLLCLPVTGGHLIKNLS